MGNQQNKTCLITGASSGIGKEFARIHAKEGGDLVIVARSEDKLNELKKELEEKYSVKVTVLVKDLGLPNSAKEVYDEIKRLNIEVDYLINNAGFGGIGKFHERKWEDDRAMIDLNITALTAFTRHFLPDFIKRDSGKILNISSSASLMPGPLQAVYYASKAYVTSFSNALSEEVHGTNITVTALLPGATETGFGKISGMDKTSLFNQTASASDVAIAGYNGMLKGKLNIIAGVPFSLRLTLAMLPFLPKKLVLRIVSTLQQTK